ncbi:MAG: DUF1513 domain-containing protein [Hoeflea sp.]|uniref:DUF1513 domain-containing protein n=1 Tax=Hoeflea sp. TaxID=1940281 RepID=UPI0032EDA5A5
MLRPLERRTFLAGAGAAFLSGLCPRSADAIDRSETLFATAFMDENKAYGFALVDQDGKLIYREAMPGRAHGFTWSKQAGRAVAFARRPGTFAIAFDPFHRNAPILFHAPEGRHFYGHGVFSKDGRKLFAAENAFEAGVGKIGIYDVSGGYSRIGEFDTFGVGPHEIIMMPDDRTLAIANGGIRTHPDFGRAKLNLAEMRSTIVFIDSRTGGKLAGFEADGEDRRMSLRHMAPAHDGSLWIGGQYQGDALAPVSPVLRLGGNGDLQQVELPEAAGAVLSDYVGAVAISPDGKLATFSSPKGGGYVTVDVATRMPIARAIQPRTSGVAASPAGVIASSEHGRIGKTSYPLHWDNHISAIG